MSHSRFLMRLILRNGISLYPVYLARFMMLIMNSLISSALTLAEKKLNYRPSISLEDGLRLTLQRDPHFRG